ncbi:hypothetical protein [Hyphomicrobium sulfonivorans]|uniref:hypothetical protein n=1 Tax=Hyphomicrobium sulfonivorans TaxID=121290 RepID=UPI00156D93A7|nr:hypothetical protein [Hyphomicrobium sulfonivorans]
MSTVTFNAVGQFSIGPTGVVLQSNWRMWVLIIRRAIDGIAVPVLNLLSGLQFPAIPAKRVFISMLPVSVYRPAI